MTKLRSLLLVLAVVFSCAAAIVVVNLDSAALPVPATPTAPALTLTVSPASGPAGSSVQFSGPCSAEPEGPDASLFVQMVSASDSSFQTQFMTSGRGPSLAVDAVVPSWFRPGQYDIEATCDNYFTSLEFLPAQFTVTTPALTVVPSSGPAGSSFQFSGPCSAEPDGPAASLFVQMVSARNPNIQTQFQTSGTGPTLLDDTVVPSWLPPGQYNVDATCQVPVPDSDDEVSSFQLIPGHFTVTPPALSVIPTSGPPGSSVQATGHCSAAPGGPAASLFVQFASASDPSIQSQVFTTSGSGPTLTVQLVVPSSFAPGQYNVDATCDNYLSSTPFAPVPFTVTGTKRPPSLAATSLTTSLTSSSRASGTSISVPVGTDVSDRATLSGVNAASAGGTVSYRVYSDSACTALVANGGTVVVSAGSIPASSAVDISIPGTYYWQASYSGDAASYNAASQSDCGGEVETVNPIPSSPPPPHSSGGSTTTTTTTTTSTPHQVTVQRHHRKEASRLAVSSPSGTPGASLSVNGTGCIPESPVVFTVDHRTVGQATADEAGDFKAPIVVPNVAVGQYAVTARCGSTLAAVAPLNITLLSDANPDGFEFVVLIFFILAGLVLVQLTVRPGRRK
jgi:hypothetical protein